MPDLAWTTDIAGGVTQQAAHETGLAPGTPVIVGTIDAASEAISVGVLDSGDMMLMYGSTIFIITLTDERLRDPRLWYAPWLFPSQHASMSGLATSGTLTHWFRDELLATLIRRPRFKLWPGRLRHRLRVRTVLSFCLTSRARGLPFTTRMRKG